MTILTEKLEAIKNKYQVPKTSSDIVQLFAMFPLLNEVCIYGTTPSFNDGDPCRHHGSYYIRYNGFLYGVEEEYYTLESVKGKSPRKIYVDDAEDGDISEEEETPEFATMILQTLGSLDSFFERDYSTNSVNIFAREGEQVNFYTCYIYCGY